MMTCNIDTADGLVNGAICTLKQTIIGHSDLGHSKPIKLWVQFENSLSAANLRQSQASLRARFEVPDNWTMIEPFSKVVKSNIHTRLKVLRKQFPIIPAEAITIHKSQGSTFESVAVFCGINAKYLSRQL
ncbi:hypothetical protein, partial, partial [Parasitella parasitica]